MKTITLAAVIVSAVAATTVPLATPAMADLFSFSFDTGNVRFAYRDGYYDHNRVWHPWSRREAQEFRIRHRDRYWDSPRRNHPNRGWPGDRDRDGVPNRFDDRPNNPRAIKAADKTDVDGADRWASSFTYFRRMGLRKFIL